MTPFPLKHNAAVFLLYLSLCTLNSGSSCTYIHSPKNQRNLRQGTKDWIKTVSGQGKEKKKNIRAGSLAGNCNNFPLMSSDVYWGWARMTAGETASVWNVNFGAMAHDRGGGSNSGERNGNIKWMHEGGCRWMNEQRRSQTRAAQNLKMAIKYWYWKHPCIYTCQMGQRVKRANHS